MEQQDTQEHDRDRGDGVGLEQVGCHARAVAHVVADVVRDHGGVARVILGNAGLDLAHQVGAHIRALGEDTPAEAGEHGDQRAAEPETDQTVDGVGRAFTSNPREHAVIAGDADERESDDEHARHRAGTESDVERAGDTTTRRLGDASVRPDRNVHADIPSARGQHPANGKADRDTNILNRDQRDEENDTDASDRRVLPVQIGAGALLNRQRDRLHLLVARRKRQQRTRSDRAIEDRARCAHKRNQDAMMRQKARQIVLRRASSSDRDEADGVRRGVLDWTSRTERREAAVTDRAKAVVEVDELLEHVLVGPGVS